MKRTCKNYGYVIDNSMGNAWPHKFDDPKELIEFMKTAIQKEIKRMNYLCTVEEELRVSLKNVYRYEKKPAFSDEDIEEIINSKRF